VYKGVGIVKRHSELCESGAESRALREAMRAGVSAFDELAGWGIQHGNLLEASMEITTYNNHRSAPSCEPWSNQRNPVYSA
jgi:hypothetical protein